MKNSDRRVTCNIQLECFISGQCSYAMPNFVYDIDSGLN